MAHSMNQKELEDLLHTWAEEEIKSTPNEHSQKISSCLSFIKFDEYVNGNIELTPEENLHIQTCPYCQKVESMFRKELIKKIDITEILRKRETVKTLIQDFIFREHSREYAGDLEKQWAISEEEFDWKNGEYRFADLSEKSFAKVGTGFTSQTIDPVVREIVIIIKILEEIRLWMTVIQRHTSLEEIESQIENIGKKYSRQLIRKLIYFLRNKTKNG